MADDLRHHAFFVRMQDADRNRARRRRDHLGIGRIARLIERDAEKFQPLANAGAN
jgi:hypothetical protein